jgi:hypothetical protein
MTEWNRKSEARVPGFYWCRVGHKGWIVAQWDKESMYWNIPGREYSEHTDGYFDEIDERPIVRGGESKK